MYMHETLLERYKVKGLSLKILIGYIKPSFLFKSDILIPIHLGRAVAKEKSKDGVISDEDYQWLLNNCLGDDDFEGNISSVNRRVGFLTGTYWAWKNYEKLGSPEYFGSFGYRRLLNPKFLENLQEYDLILPKKRNLNIETIKEQFLRYHGEEILDIMMKSFSLIYPDEVKSLEAYLNLTSGYFDEIYVMKKNLFFDFCNWIFPLLFELLKKTFVELNNGEKRDLGFIIERLTGYFLYKLKKKEILNFCETDIVITEKLCVNRSNLSLEFLAKLRKKL